ncbi:MAG: hypothetical protein R3C14_43660 [Caldilineaceae bacterium]
MNRRNIIIGAVVVVAVIALVAYFVLQSLTIRFPTSAEAGVSFETVASVRPEGSTCVNKAGEQEGIAKEMISTEDFVVSLAYGNNPISDAAWADYTPSSPYRKNLNRDTLFSDHCFYRSPDAPVGCAGESCSIMREVDGYTWMELSAVVSQDCFANEGASCSPSGVDAGAISVTVTRKCHQIIYTDEIYQLADPAGNLYVMHATATGTPDLNPALPDGWTLQRMELDAPLEILPFGGGDNCYHNVLRDNLGQGYHQYVFAADHYPAP